METQLSLFGEPIGRLLHDVDGFDWNVPRLLEDYEDLKDEMKEFSDYNPRWLKVHRAGPAGMHHALSWKNIVGGGRVAVGYYRQLRGEEIKEHTDTGCKTRINVLLTDGGCTLHIGGNALSYSAALINVNQYRHSVGVADRDRIIFSLIFLDHDYYEVKRRYGDYQDTLVAA